MKAQNPQNGIAMFLSLREIQAFSTLYKPLNTSDKSSSSVEGRHIIRVSGHKSLESVQNYARKLSSARKRSISTIFSNSVENKKMNLEEQNKKPQPISNDSVHSFFNIFDKKDSPKRRFLSFFYCN